MLVLQESSQVCLLLRQAHLTQLLRPQDTVGPTLPFLLSPSQTGENNNKTKDFFSCRLRWLSSDRSTSPGS